MFFFTGFQEIQEHQKHKANIQGRVAKKNNEHFTIELKHSCHINGGERKLETSHFVSYGHSIYSNSSCMLNLHSVVSNGLT